MKTSRRGGLWSQRQREFTESVPRDPIAIAIKAQRIADKEKARIAKEKRRIEKEERRAAKIVSPPQPTIARRPTTKGLKHLLSTLSREARFFIQDMQEGEVLGRCEYDLDQFCKDCKLTEVQEKLIRRVVGQFFQRKSKGW